MRGVKILLSGFFALISGDLLATPSLLFTDEEVSFIQENYSNQNTDFLEESSEKLSLTAIIYFDESHWSLWVNDKVIGPETRGRLAPFYVEKVNPDEVIFSWTSSSSTTFSLSPSQTIIFKK